MGAAAAVSVRGVSKSFGSNMVLDECTFDVAPAEIVALLGPSGCGKSTLLRIIAGLERLDGGVVELASAHGAQRVVAGSDPASGKAVHVAPERRGVGLVFQNGALFAHLDVAHNIAFGLAKGEDRTSRVSELLAMVDLAGFEDRYPDQLSGGQQQRVALARALAPRPAVVLLDEPFSNLDARLRRSLRREVTEVLRRSATPTVIVTHDRDEAFAVADRVAVMRDGRIAQFGTPSDVYDRPVDDWVARFVGDANFLEVRTVGDREVDTLADTVVGPVRVGAPAAAGDTVMIRPECLTFERTSAWPLGRVVGVEYTGATLLVDVDVDVGAEVDAKADAGAVVTHGSVRLRSEQSTAGAAPLRIDDRVVVHVHPATVAHRVEVS